MQLGHVYLLHLSICNSYEHFSGEVQKCIDMVMRFYR